MQRYGIGDLGQQKHLNLLKKYPDLLASLSTFTSLKLKSEGRILRRDTERIKRFKKLRKQPNNLRLKKFENTLFRAMDQKTLLFICPVCRSVLKRPVTLECGHTFCGACLVSVDNNYLFNKCTVCVMELADQSRSTNVLVQELVEKWRDRNKCNDNYGKSHPKCLSIVLVAYFNLPR